MQLSKPAIITGVVLLTFALIAAIVIGNYNSLVTSRNQVNKSWASVQTQYQRRFDLIGNLVGSVKGAQGQELKVFTALADARKQYASASNPSAQAAAASQIETNVALVPRMQEAYPDLKSNATVTSLMNQLTTTEDGVLKARDTYNDTANNYNTNIESFPKNVYAGLFGYRAFVLFKADSAAQSAPKVSF